jgi:arsenite methyltransferase
VDAGLDVAAFEKEIDGRFMAAFVRARKPVEARSCCGPNCCS